MRHYAREDLEGYLAAFGLGCLMVVVVVGLYAVLIAYYGHGACP